MGSAVSPLPAGSSRGGLANSPTRPAGAGFTAIRFPAMSVRYEERGHVAVITIDRPEARNAVNGDVARGI